MDIIKSNNTKLDETASLIHTGNREVIDFINEFRTVEQQISVLHSVKLTKTKAITDRVAIVIDYSDSSNLYTLDKLLVLLNEYNFPQNCVAQLSAEYNASTFTSFNVCVGIEVDEDKTRYKVYLENSATKNLFAIKWDATSYVVTNYIFKEKTHVEEVIHEAGFETVPQIVLDNISKLTQVYLTKDVVNSTRVSFDLAFNDIYLKDVTTHMLSLTSVDVLNNFDYLKTYPIRTIAGGLDANGDKYFTLYFVV